VGCKASEGNVEGKAVAAKTLARTSFKMLQPNNATHRAPLRELVEVGMVYWVICCPLVFLG
jgi:hypothetical protein